MPIKNNSSIYTRYIYAAINILAQHKEVQRRIHNEIRHVLGSNHYDDDDDDEGSSRPVSMSDRPSMPYTSATVLELLRYASLSPIFIPHRTLVDTRIGSVHIPADTTVFVYARAVHHDPDFWTDPFAFRPERFLVADGGGAGTRLVGPDDERRRRVMSFGAGPRSCPGEAIATTRLFLAVANVVRRFVVEPETDEPGRQTPCDPRSYDPGLVLSPRDFRARFVSR